MNKPKTDERDVVCARIEFSDFSAYRKCLMIFGVSFHLQILTNLLYDDNEKDRKKNVAITFKNKFDTMNGTLSHWIEPKWTERRRNEATDYWERQSIFLYFHLPSKKKRVAKRKNIVFLLENIDIFFRFVSITRHYQFAHLTERRTHTKRWHCDKRRSNVIKNIDKTCTAFNNLHRETRAHTQFM